jgi:hypothetical protein
MSYKTLEVELDNGRVRPCGAETLPAKARALLTLLEPGVLQIASTCGELAEKWNELEKLPPDEANSFAEDIERSRANLPPVKPAWD